MGGTYAPLSRFAMITDSAHDRLLRRHSVCCGGNDFHQNDDDDTAGPLEDGDAL
jgi:hypothetical protein